MVRLRVYRSVPRTTRPTTTATRRSFSTVASPIRIEPRSASGGGSGICAGPQTTLAHWKLQSVDSYAGDRPLAWIDDAFNPACHLWAEERPAPTLLVRTNPELGLTRAEAQRLEGWARGLRAS